jgi:hypothetical protein
MKAASPSNKSQNNPWRSQFLCWRNPEPSISWWTPRWFLFERVRRFQRILLNRKSLSKVSLWSTIVGALIIAAFKIECPSLGFGFVCLAIRQTIGVTVGLYAMCLGICFLPSKVTISREAIFSPTGESGFVLTNDIVSLRLTMYRPDRSRLSILYKDHNGSVRLAQTGVPSTVNLDTLREISPIGVRIIDARARFEHLQAPR